MLLPVDNGRIPGTGISKTDPHNFEIDQLSLAKDISLVAEIFP